MLKHLIASVPAQDGAGVNIRRIAGERVHEILDPFLMVDQIRSGEQADYMAGFPAHPHRGFETITYLLSGRMKHEDHMGHTAVMTDGGVQWMTAGRGVVHSEMPEQTAGQFHGFQVWLNLPSELKLTDAAYHEISADEINHVSGKNWSSKIIAGELSLDDQIRIGPFPAMNRTRAAVADVRLDAGAELKLDAGEDRKLLVYTYAGSDAVIAADHLAVYMPGTATLKASSEGLSALVLAGEPLAEPVVQYGPFVMNTREQIEAAIRDYSAGELTG